LWRKGATSGHRQRLVELRIDCDRDCLLLVVDQAGPACHTNRPSCFYTAVRDGTEVVLADPVP
jgi:phosphoribosyl-AMP cyclohydrolase